MFRLIFAFVVIVVVGFIWFVVVQYRNWTEDQKNQNNDGPSAPKQPNS